MEDKGCLHIYNCHLKWSNQLGIHKRMILHVYIIGFVILYLVPTINFLDCLTSSKLLRITEDRFVKFV